MVAYIAGVLGGEHRIVAARDGREGLELARSYRPDLVLTDVMMPRMNGIELARELRAERSFDGVPIVFLTARADEDLKLKVLGSGAQDFLAKPFSPDELAARVGNLIAMRRVREALERAVRTAETEAELRERFMAILGHDLRSPLAAITGSAVVLRRSGVADAKVLDRIDRAAARMNEMIRDLLDLARARAGGIPIRNQRIDLTDVARRGVDEAQSAHPGRVIRLEVSGDCRGHGDPDRLAQLLANLLSNALAHGADAAPVTVRLSRNGDDVRLTVHNVGDPIPPEALPTLFAPFRRASTTSAGLGLGLYIVREIARAHGGDVGVRSTETEGTTVEVVLPLPRSASTR